MEIALTCPLDDLPLVAATPLPVTGGPDAITRDAAEHLHMEHELTGTCVNGHAWWTDVAITLLRGTRPVRGVLDGGE
jgi:hypothetical protein